ENVVPAMLGSAERVACLPSVMSLIHDFRHGGSVAVGVVVSPRGSSIRAGQRENHRRCEPRYPSSMPFNTACVLDLTPSFNRMLDTWFLTVPSVVPNAWAISRLL